MTDEELMLAYQRGDEKAFWELYRRYSGRIYGYLVGRLKSRATADDLFQTAFLKFHQSRHRYDSEFAFAPWIFTIVRNTWIDHLRREAKRNEAPLTENLAAPMPANPVAVPSLEGLSDQQRSALAFRYGEDLSFDDIAKRLDTSTGNVRQIISRAVRKLRRKS